MLTERKEAWSPRCPRFSLQVGAGGAEEVVKAGGAFPPEAPPPLGALLLACLRKPAGRWGRGGGTKIKGHIVKMDMEMEKRLRRRG